MRETTIMEKTTEKTSEIISNQTFRQSAKAFCLICQQSVKLLSFAETAELFETTVQNILQTRRRTELHLLHNRRGVVMICKNSVADILNQRQMMISNPRIMILKPLS